MADFFDTLTDKRRDFIAKQPVFFVATAAQDARINLSPKGYDGYRLLVMDLRDERKALLKYHGQSDAKDWVEKPQGRTQSIDGLPVRPTNSYFGPAQ